MDDDHELEKLYEEDGARSVKQAVTNVPTISGRGGMSMFSILFNIFGCVMFIVDLVLDLKLVHLYWTKQPCNFDSAIADTPKIFNSTNPRNELAIDINYKLYAKICLGLSLIPTYIQSACSYYIFWRHKVTNYNAETYRRDMFVLLLFHIVPVHFVYRSFFCIMYSCKFYNDQNEEEKNRYWRHYVGSKQDLVFLKVIDACLECAPQLILQIYVYRLESHQDCFHSDETAFFGLMTAKTFQQLKIFLSWFAMTQNFAFYPNDQRLREDKFEDGISGTLNFVLVLALNFLWHGFTIGIRVALFAFMIAIHPMFSFISICAHAFVFFLIAKLLFKTDYVDEQITPSIFQQVLRLIYELLCGMILTFTWVNLFRRNDDQHQKRMILYYVVMTFENLVFLMIWYAHRTLFDPMDFHWLGKDVSVDVDLVALWTIPCFYIYGLLFMIVYYTYCHPTLHLKS